MKKIQILGLVIALLIGTPCITKAIQAQNIEEQKTINQNIAQQLQSNGVLDIMNKIDQFYS